VKYEYPLVQIDDNPEVVIVDCMRAEQSLGVIQLKQAPDGSWTGFCYYDFWKMTAAEYVSTPDPTQYHEPDDKQRSIVGPKGTMIARHKGSDGSEYPDGRSLGFDHNATGMVHIDPTETFEGIAVDFAKLARQSMKGRHPVIGIMPLNARAGMRITQFVKREMPEPVRRLLKDPTLPENRKPVETVDVKTSHNDVKE